MTTIATTPGLFSSAGANSVRFSADSSAQIVPAEAPLDATIAGPHAELRAAFARSVPAFIATFPAPIRGDTADYLTGRFERALERIEIVEPAELGAMLSNVQRVAQILRDEGIDSSALAAQGFDIGFIKAVDGPRCSASLPLRDFAVITSDAHIVFEHKRDDLITRNSVAIRMPEVDKPIIYRTEMGQLGPMVTQWCTISEFKHPRLPQLTTVADVTLETEHLLGDRKLYSEADSAAALTLPTDEIGNDFTRMLSSVLSTIDPNTRENPRMAHVTGLFAQVVRHFATINHLRNRILEGSPNSPDDSVRTRIIRAYDDVLALSRSAQTSVSVTGIFTSPEMQSLRKAFSDVVRTSHLLLHTIGIDSDS